MKPGKRAGRKRRRKQRSEAIEVGLLLREIARLPADPPPEARTRDPDGGSPVESTGDADFGEPPDAVDPASARRKR